MDSCQHCSEPKRKRRQPITFDDLPKESNEIESLGAIKQVKIYHDYLKTIIVK